MAKERKRSFVFNCGWQEVLMEYPAEVRLEVYDAIIRYVASGTLSELKPLSKMAFSFIKKEIDYNNARYDDIIAKRSEAGRKGMQSRYAGEVTDDNKNNKCYQSVTKLTEPNKANLNDNDNDNVNVSSNEDDINPHSPKGELPPLPGAALPQDEISVDSDDGLKATETTPPPGSAPPPSPKRKVFKKPDVEEIRAYCAERHNSVDAEHFYDHYEANGWKIGGKSPMKDWRAAVRTWEKNNASYGRKEQRQFGNTRPGDFAGKGYTDI